MKKDKLNLKVMPLKSWMYSLDYLNRMRDYELKEITPLYNKPNFYLQIIDTKQVCWFEIEIKGIIRAFKVSDITDFTLYLLEEEVLKIPRKTIELLRRLGLEGLLSSKQYRMVYDYDQQLELRNIRIGSGKFKIKMMKEHPDMFKSWRNKKVITNKVFK